MADDRVRALQRAHALAPDDQELRDELLLEAARAGLHVMVRAGGRFESRGVLFEGEVGGDVQEQTEDGEWVTVEEPVPITIRRKRRFAPVWRCSCGFRGTVRPRRNPDPTCPRTRVPSPASTRVGPRPAHHEATELAGAGGSLPPAPAAPNDRRPGL